MSKLMWAVLAVGAVYMWEPTAFAWIRVSEIQDWLISFAIALLVQPWVVAQFDG